MFQLPSQFWHHHQISAQNTSISTIGTTTSKAGTTALCSSPTAAGPQGTVCSSSASAERRASAATFSYSVASSTVNECAVMIVPQGNDCTTKSVITDRETAAEDSPLRRDASSLCCCSLRIGIVLLMPLLPIGVLLLSYLLLPSSNDRTTEMIGYDKRPLLLEDALVRLPTDVVPIHYELHLKVFLPFRPFLLNFGTKNLTVDGNLRLLLLCRAPTDVLMLHAKALSIEHAKTTIWPDELRHTAGPKVIEWKELAGGNDLVELKLDKALLPGRKYMLEIDYKAKIGKAHEGGLFLGSYTSEDREEIRLLAATQMQPLDARRLLPCFDEPNFKADFSISVQHPEGTTVLSNAPLAHFRQRMERGWSLSLFERTPKMATYMLALTVSDFKHKETTYKDVTIRVWVQPSKLAYTEHALDVSVRSLEYLEDYFGIPYPLKKLDIFGVPFLRVAAMENWGLIMAQEQNLVYTDGVQAKRERKFITDVLAHEITHMWFGDLVTMEWWDDLWLNEGFATIMGMKAADYVENSTSRTSQLFYEHTVKAFRFDQIAHQAHALSYKISSVREVARRFDHITYLKAAAVLRMVERTVGEQMFKRGLRSFLRLFAYRNARSADLLRALSATMAANNRSDQAALSVVNFSLGEFMDSWTYQNGFPLITLKTARNKSLLVADQEQFFYLEPSVPNPSRWKVPLFFDTTKHKQTVWLLENGSVHVPRGALIDANAHGYYRIQYDNGTYRALICTLMNNHTQIEVVTRARLLEDTFTIARAGRLPLSLVLSMAEYLPYEHSYLPFLVFNNHVQLVLLLLRNHPKIGIFRQFIQQMIEPMYRRVFSPNLLPDDLSDTMREFAMIHLCHFDYLPCVNKSLTDFAQLKEKCQNHLLSDRQCNSIPPELRGSIYGTAIRFGTTRDFEFLRKKYSAEQYDSEKGRILTGLASTRNIDLVSSLINDFLHDKRAFEQDFYSFLLKFVKSPILNQIVAYMRNNFKALAKKIRHSSIMKVVLTYITKWRQSERELREFDAFELENVVELRDLRLLAYMKELRLEIRANIEFVGRGAVEIFDYLDKRNRSGKSGRKKTANDDDQDECLRSAEILN